MSGLVLYGRLITGQEQSKNERADDGSIRGGIYIKEGIIQQLLQPGDTCCDKDARRLDFGDAYISSSFIDFFGFVAGDKELLAMEQQEAAAGGFSHLVCMPYERLRLDTLASVLWLSQQSDQVQLLPVAALTQGLKGEVMSQLAKLRAMGAIAFSQGRSDLDNTRTLLNCYEYISSIDGLLIVSPRDLYLGEGNVAEDAIAWQTGLPAVPQLAETLSLQRHLMLVEKAGVRTHFAALSCAASLTILAFSVQSFSADISLPHLVFTARDLSDYDTIYYTDPPLGSQEQQELLRQALKKHRTVSAISSLHRSLLRDDLHLPVQQAQPGMATRSLFLPLALDLVRNKILSLSQLIHLMTTAPAHILGLEHGELKEGRAANLCVFDMDERWTVQKTPWTAANTPLIGSDLVGRVLLTLHKGVEVYRARDQ